MLSDATIKQYRCDIINYNCVKNVMIIHEFGQKL